MSIIVGGRAIKKSSGGKKARIPDPIPDQDPAKTGPLLEATRARFLADYQAAVEAKREAESARAEDAERTAAEDDAAAMVARWDAEKRVMTVLELHHAEGAEAAFLSQYGPGDVSSPWSARRGYYSDLENQYADRLALRMSDGEARREARRLVAELRDRHQHARREAGLS